MKTLYMLDTDTCSYIIKGTRPELIAKVKVHQKQLCISSITLAEFFFGVTKKNSPRLTTAVDLFHQLVDVRSWTSETARHYAAIRNELERSGTLIGNMDMLIAASAKADNACLVTNNISHFSRISGLKIENWLD